MPAGFFRFVHVVLCHGECPLLELVCAGGADGVELRRGRVQEDPSPIGGALGNWRSADCLLCSVVVAMFLCVLSQMDRLLGY